MRPRSRRSIRIDHPRHVRKVRPPIVHPKPHPSTSHTQKKQHKHRNHAPKAGRRRRPHRNRVRVHIKHGRIRLHDQRLHTTGCTRRVHERLQLCRGRLVSVSVSVTVTMTMTMTGRVVRLLRRERPKRTRHLVQKQVVDRVRVPVRKVVPIHRRRRWVARLLYPVRRREPHVW